jgi:predicted transcriptional regulator
MRRRIELLGGFTIRGSTGIGLPRSIVVVKHPSLGGTLEYAVMSVLWELGKATTREIHARVGEPVGLAYTTTATVCDRLHDKGCCSRMRVGKSFTYMPAISRDHVDRERAKETVTKLIGDDPVPAIACLVEAIESLDPKLLGELARVTAARRKARDGS